MRFTRRNQATDTKPSPADPPPAFPGNGPADAVRATFAAGCFWGIEAAFRELEGVVQSAVGYTGGALPGPTYRQVCSGATGHAEAVEIYFDPTRITYEQLLASFWQMHNPTTRNRQGMDIGSQYRSAIFTHTPQQHAAALASREHEQAERRRAIVTEVAPASAFYPAEEYHQRYFEKSGRAACAVTLVAPSAPHASMTTNGATP